MDRPHLCLRLIVSLTPNWNTSLIDTASPPSILPQSCQTLSSHRAATGMPSCLLLSLISLSRRLGSSFKYLEKISLGRGDPLLRLIGQSSAAPLLLYPRQLVLRGCTSVVIGGMYKRLLRRSLVAITATLSVGKYSSETERYEIVCSAGCGVSELLWAIVCEEIANSFSSQRSVQSDPQNPFSILIAAIQSKVQEHLGKVSSAKNLPLLLSSLLRLCRHLSESYLQIPSLLVSNHQRSQGVGSFHVQRDLLLWKQNLKSRLGQGPPASGPFEDYSVKLLESEDSLGMNGGVFSLGEAFFDGTDCSSSLSHSAAAFSTLLEALRINLRIGGRGGVVQTRRKPRQVRSDRRRETDL
jgi:hypothetical protein